MLFAKVDHRIFIAARNCSGDGFSALYYNKTDSSGHATLRFFKYKYIEDIQNDLMYNFNQVMIGYRSFIYLYIVIIDYKKTLLVIQAVEKCLEMNSTLWEILDGHDEWKGVIAMAR